MTVSVAGTPTIAEGNGLASLTCNVPTGASVGEWLVAAVANSATTTIATPAGWTKVIEVPRGSIGTAFFTRLATASEPASYTWTGLTGRATVEMLRIAGADTAAFDLTPDSVVGSSTSIVLPTITTLSSNTFVLNAVAIESATTDDLAPPATDTKVITTTGTGRRLTISTEQRPTAGATGTRTWTWGTALNSIGMRMVFKSATKLYTFDEGTDGTSVPVAGDITQNSGVTYTQAGAIHGSMGITGNGTNSALFITKPGNFVAASGAHSGSIYLTPRVVTSGAVRFVVLQASANGILGSIRVHSDGKFDISNAGNARVTPSTLTWTAGTRYRVDWYYDGTTLQAKIFAGTNLEGTVPDETISGTVSAGTFHHWYISPSANSTAGMTVELDTLRLYDGNVTPLPYAPPSLAAVVRQRVKAATTTQATTLTATLPSATLVGSTLIALITTTTGSAAITMPGGWTLRSSNTSMSVNSFVYDFQVTATNQNSLALTLPAGGATIYLIEANGLSGFDKAVNSANVGPSATVTTTSLTPATASTYLLAFISHDNNTTDSFGAPVAYVDQHQLTGSTSATFHSAYAEGQVTGTTARTVTITPAASISGWEAHAVAYIVGSPASISTLTDDFATKDTAKWLWSPTASAVGGQLSLPADSGYSAYLTSTARYNLNDSAAFVRLVQRAGPGNGSVDTQMLVNVDSNNLIKISLGGANLNFIYIVGGTPTTVASVTYSATTHAWWRIRESSGVIYWDTSPDAVTWTQRASWTHSFSVTSITLQLQSGYWNTETSPGTAIFDNVNILPALPKIESLTDTFIGPSIDGSKWIVSANASIVSGRLNLTTSASYQGINSVGSYDLTDSYAAWELVQRNGPGTGNTQVSEFVLGTSAGDRLSFYLEGTTLEASKKAGGVETTVNSATYNATTMRWMRIRHTTAGGVDWQYSADGLSWTTLGTWTPTFNITSMDFMIQTGWWGTETTSTTLIVDNFNSPGSGTTFKLWNGTTEVSVILDGVWNGTSIVPVTSKLWNGSAEV